MKSCAATDASVWLSTSFKSDVRCIAHEPVDPGANRFGGGGIEIALDMDLPFQNDRGLPCLGDIAGGRKGEGHLLARLAVIGVDEDTLGIGFTHVLIADVYGDARNTARLAVLFHEGADRDHHTPGEGSFEPLAGLYLAGLAPRRIARLGHRKVHARLGQVLKVVDEHSLGVRLTRSLFPQPSQRRRRPARPFR